MKKQAQVFLTSVDEAALSRAILDRYERVVFVDDNVWGSSEPPEQIGIGGCRSRFVYIWNKNVAPQLPVLARPDGRYEGPISGVVVQYVRSTIDGPLILSGRLAVGIRDEADDAQHGLMRDFVSGVWKALRKVATEDIVAVNPTTRVVVNPHVKGYFAGLDASVWCQADTGRSLKDRSTENYFLPRQAAHS
jgi:hypothetical protein